LKEEKKFLAAPLLGLCKGYSQYHSIQGASISAKITYIMYFMQRGFDIGKYFHR
jgi:hypothetical protein